VIRRISTHVKCAICKEKLQGTTSSNKASKTEKRPTRKFGGNLCYKCTRRVIKIQTRVNDKTLKMEDVEPKYKRYIK